MENEGQFWWLWSRLRSRAKNNPSVWVSMNPDPDHFWLKYVQWWLSPEGTENAGRPDPEKNGKIRYLLRIGGNLVWGDTPEELQEEYGYDKQPISVQGLFGTIDDNMPLQRENPQYKSNLEALPRIDRERLLHGNWFARPEGLGMIKREWFIEEDQEPPWTEIEKTVRSYDFAFTKKSDKNPSPDYTCSVKISKLKSGDYFIHDVRQTRILPGEWLDFILEAAREDGPRVDIQIPLDPGAGAAFANKVLAKEIAAAGFFVRQMRSQGAKIDRFRPFASMVMNGGMRILKNCCSDYENGIFNDNTFYYNQLEAFDGRRGARKRGEDGHDDLCDASADAFEAAATHIKIPNISYGLKNLNLTTNNPFLDN